MLTESSRTAFSMCFLGVAFILMASLTPSGGLISHGRKVKRPLTTEPTYLVGEVTDPRITIVAGVSNSGAFVPRQWWIGESPYDRREFLRQLAREKPPTSRRALVTADARLQFGEVVATLDALSIAGFERAFLIAAGPRQIFLVDLLRARDRGHILEAGTQPAIISSTQPHNSALQPSGAPGSD